MKVLPFTIPVTEGSTLIVQEEDLRHFYPHLHRHAEVQVTWIREGEGTLLAGGSMHFFKQGDIFVIGADQPHLFKSDPLYFAEESDLRVSALTIFFDPKGKASSLFALPEMRGVRAFFEQWNAGFRLPDELCEDLRQMMTAVKDATGGLQLARFVTLLSAISGISNPAPLSMAGAARPLTDPEGERIASVYAYIMNNFAAEMSLEEVASLVHLTPNAFCRYFKKHTRATFVGFLNKVRVNEACKLLLQGDRANIAHIAYSCGFGSVTNFNYVFRKMMGKTPREYVSEVAKATGQAR